MAFEIEEITENVSKSIKKNPVPWVIGGGAALVGGYFLFFRGRDGYITSAYPETPVLPDDLADVGSGEPGGGLTDTALLDLLAQLDSSRAEDLQKIAEMQQSFLQSLASALSDYQYAQQDYYSQYEPQYGPQYEPQYGPQYESTPMAAGDDLLAKASYIYETPSLIFSEQGVSYTPEQVGTMYDWAMEENAAISKGYAGTSKTPSSLAGSDMTITYYPSGHVAFTPKGSPKPKDPGPSDFQREVERRGQEAATKLSQQTGKSGTIEQQLAGMSQSDKLSTLRDLGLIS